MKSHRPATAALPLRSGQALAALIAAMGCWALVGHGQVPLPAQPQLPLEPLGLTNEAIFAAFEGWGPDKDGQNVFLLGYLPPPQNLWVGDQ